MIGNIIGACILGILAGFLARALLPGKQSMNFLATMLLGIAGAIAGYYIFAALGIGDTDKCDLGGLPGAVIGAIILLWLYERFVANRAEPTAAVGGEPAPAGGPAERRARRRERRQR